MFRVVYINSNNDIAHKGGFNQISEAMNWISTNNVTALKIMVFNDYIDCFSTVIEL